MTTPTQLIEQAANAYGAEFGDNHSERVRVAATFEAGANYALSEPQLWREVCGDLLKYIRDNYRHRDRKTESCWAKLKHGPEGAFEIYYTDAEVISHYIEHKSKK